MKWNVPSYCRFRLGFTNTTPDWARWARCGNLNRTGRSWMACIPSGSWGWTLLTGSVWWLCKMWWQSTSQRRSLSGWGDYFLTSWNFTQLYFQMILSKRGSLNDCKQPNKWKEHVIYVWHSCGLWEAGMCLGFGFKHILLILLKRCISAMLSNLESRVCVVSKLTLCPGRGEPSSDALVCSLGP